jgi:hypothetical protein
LTQPRAAAVCDRRMNLATVMGPPLKDARR